MSLLVMWTYAADIYGVYCYLYGLLQEMPYKSKGIRGQWDEMTMNKAVNTVIVHKKFVKAAAREYGLPLETLR